MSSRVELLTSAIARRAELLAALAAENTDCVRLLHGVAEGAPGTTIDRYGPVLLVQTWREALEPGELDLLARSAEAQLGATLLPVWTHRPRADLVDTTEVVEPTFNPDAASAIGHELGLAYDVRPQHRGQDPLLFLDFRVARRWVKANASNKDVLNLYAYTCGVGVAAAAGGAKSVVNVDFSGSALEIGRANAERNGVASAFTTLLGDAQVIARQFAGLSVSGRGGKRPEGRPARSFDLVVLDPPRWAKSNFGAVDVVRDYPSLFKPALLATRTGGAVMATNHVPKVDREAWLAVLRRTAEKAGRPLASIEILTPEADFPSTDGSPPLKIALCHVA